MSQFQATGEYGRRRDKDADNTVTAQDGSSSSSRSTPGVKTSSFERGKTIGGGMVPPNETPDRFAIGEEVYDNTERDSSGNLKKKKYWVCCRRTRNDIKEYRLKDEEPDNWDKVRCNSQHEGHWVAEEDLIEWD